MTERLYPKRFYYFESGEVPEDIVVNMQNCDIVVSKFELQLRYYVHFWTNIFEKGMNHLIPHSYELNNTITVFLQGWVWHKITQQG